MRSFTITTVWGIPIRVNVSLVVFLPVLAWLIASGGQIPVYAELIDGIVPASLDAAALRTGWTPWLVGTGAAVGLFASVAIHELGHSWAARRYGLAIDSITLWIFGGVASMEIPREWNRELWIAVAGPATSVLLGFGCYLLALSIPPSLPAVLFVVGWLAVTNVVLAAFNLLPAFPMDGGRVFRALLARRRNYVQATQIAAATGQTLALLLALLGVISFNVVLVLVALFVYGAASTESRTVVVTELLRDVTVADLMTTELDTVTAEATVSELASRMLYDHHTGYPVTDGSETVIGMVTLADSKKVSPAERDVVYVSDIMSRDLITVPADADATDAFRTMIAHDIGRVLVRRDDTIVGIVSRSDVVNALQLLRETSDAEEQDDRQVRRAF